jgi:hypothetical protein
MAAVPHDLLEVVGATVKRRSATVWLAADGTSPTGRRGAGGGSVGARS